MKNKENEIKCPGINKIIDPTKKEDKNIEYILKNNDKKSKNTNKIIEKKQ